MRTKPILDAEAKLPSVRWTASMVRTLTELWTDRTLRANEIATRMGLREQQVKQKGHKLKLASRRGGEIGGAKLRWENMAEIHALRSSGLSLAKIGDRFGVSGPTISRIVTGDGWKNRIIPSVQVSLPDESIKTHKICTSCKQDLDNSHFAFLRRKDRLKSHCRKCCTADMMARYAANPTPVKERMKRRYREEPGFSAAAKARVAAWKAANPERAKAAQKAWREANAIARRSAAAVRRARQSGSPDRYTKADIEFLLNLQRSKCAHSWCRSPLRKKYHIDHIKPLAIGGSNGRKNLQLLCAPCNLRKGPKHPVDFAQQNGALL